MASEADFADTQQRNYPFDEEIIFNTLVSTYENWVEQRRLKSSQGRRIWKLNFYPITLAESIDIYDFFSARHGNYEQFKFTNPLDSIKYDVRFVEGSLKRSRMHYSTFKVELQLLEIL